MIQKTDIVAIRKLLASNKKEDQKPVEVKGVACNYVEFARLAGEQQLDCNQACTNRNRETGRCDVFAPLVEGVLK